MILCVWLLFELLLEFFDIRYIHLSIYVVHPRTRIFTDVYDSFLLVSYFRKKTL